MAHSKKKKKKKFFKKMIIARVCMYVYVLYLGFFFLILKRIFNRKLLCCYK